MATTIGERVRLHWPTRETSEESAAHLSRIMDSLRFKHGFNYNDTRRFLAKCLVRLDDDKFAEEYEQFCFFLDSPQGRV